jgi:hypothetical protein
MQVHGTFCGGVSFRGDIHYCGHPAVRILLRRVSLRGLLLRVGIPRCELGKFWIHLSDEYPDGGDLCL